MRNLLWSVSFFIVLLLGLGGVAFLTLLERKILSLSQLRLGPNKVMLWGVLQPIWDGVKLLLKEGIVPVLSQGHMYMLFPVGLLLFFFILWSAGISWGLLFNSTSVLIVLAILGLGTYLLMLSGWSLTSPFSKLGSVRSMLQGLSFEVSLVLVVLTVCLSFSALSVFKLGVSLEVSFFWVLMWSVLMLLDTNRAPFDLLEGESELISGFNIEMGGLLFVTIFLSEYGMLLVSSLLGSLMLTGNLFLLSCFWLLVFLFVRSCFPRMRYDLVSGLMWQSVLGVGLFMFLMFFWWKFA